jgi:urease accessory protein
LVAAAANLPRYVYWTVAAFFGLTHGYDNGAAIVEPVRAYVFIPGVLFAALLVGVYGAVIADYANRKNVYWMHIAVRAAGSWIAAIGMLALAMNWKSHAGG